MINKLTIVHCKLDDSIKVDSLLTSIRSISPNFAPETCSRHIYFFVDLSFYQKLQLKQFCDELKDKVKHVEILDSFDAYEFLLQWSVGLLSDKHKHNDHFVLGRLRFLWTSYTHEVKGTPLLEKLMAIIPKLLEWSSLVRSYIQSDLEKLKPSVRIEITKQYCSNIRRSMEEPHYRLEKPCFDLTPVLTEDTLVELQSKHARLRYDIVALQKDMSNQTIKPRPAEDDKASIAQLRRFSVALRKIHEKRIIESEIENLRHGLASE